MMRLFGTVIVSGLLAASLVACGGDEDTAAGPCDVKVTGSAGQKPAVTVPDCDPPSDLKSRDITEGTGPAAKQGDAVEVHYLGVAWSTKKQFDTSWAPGRKPYVVQPLGQAGVIDGWNQGLVGIKTGGRRLLVIPAALGYRDQPQGEHIKAGETLVFVVDIVSINGK